MRKILIISSIFLATLFTKQAGAQSLYAGINFTNQAGAYSDASTINLYVSSSQTTAPNTIQTLSNNLSEGLNLYAPQSTVLGPVYYWDAPSFIHPLTFSIGSSNYVTVTNRNPSGGFFTYYVTINWTNNEGTVSSLSGSTVTISAGATGNVYLPAMSQTWSNPAYFPNNSTYGFPTPITIVLNWN